MAPPPVHFLGAKSGCWHSETLWTLGGGAADCVSKEAEQHCKDLTSRLLAPKQCAGSHTRGKHTQVSELHVEIDLDLRHLFGLAEHPR